MITDEQLALITAGIDGELTPTEGRALRRLLVACAEARALYERLRADSDRLRGLPSVPVPADLHARVLARVATATTPADRRPATRPLTRRGSRWVPVAVAASTLVAVAGVSYWFFTRQQTPGRSPGGTDTGWVKSLPPAGGASPSTPADKPRPVPGGGVGETNPGLPLPRSVDRGDLALAPEPRPTPRDLHAFPAGFEIPPFDFVEVRVPFLKALADFDREDIRQELTHQLGRDPAFRIDLFTRDPARAVDLFQAAARSVGVSVLTDAGSAERLRKRQATAAVIYTESLTPAVLGELIARLAADDAKISPRVFDVVHATPAGATEQKAITELLGTDPGLFKRPAAPDKLIDASKPISDGTADHVVKSLTGTGKPGDRTAILLTPGSVARTSAEVKQYLQKRGPRQPNAVPVILVIRSGNG